MKHAIVRTAALGLLCSTAVGLTVVRAAETGKEQIIKLKMDPTGAPKTAGYLPVLLPLSADKPAQITKEPTYKGTPKYGVIHLGNGPKADTVFAVDMPTEGDYKIYVDKNHNGDLTDDGDGAWSAKREGQRAMYGLNHYTLRASYGTTAKETGSADYGVALYQFVGQDRVIMYREAGATGMITVEGKPHKAVLVENDADALFAKPMGDDGKPLKGMKATKPVWLFIDLNDDGKFTRDEIFDARAPFALGKTTVEPIVAANGTEIKLKPTTRVAYAPPKAPEPPKLLTAGTLAPDFTAQAPDGHTVKLSDYRGKVVVLDFWATWCPPCRASMPHLQHLHETLSSKGVKVLGICVSDEKSAFDKWIPEHKELTFECAYDLAGRSGNSISGKLYNVSGIPTTYIIDKDGKVLEAIVGYEEGDKRVEAALKKAGVEVDAKSASIK